MDILNKYIDRLFEENIRSLKQRVRKTDAAYVLAVTAHGKRSLVARGRLGHRTACRKYLAQVEELRAEFLRGVK